MKPKHAIKYFILFYKNFKSPERDFGELDGEDDYEEVDSEDIQTSKRVTIQNGLRGQGQSLDMINMRDQQKQVEKSSKNEESSQKGKNSTQANNLGGGNTSTENSEFDSNFEDGQDMIHEIKMRVEEEKEKILLMKTKYVQKLDDKNELEKLLAKCINDYKEELWAIKSKMKFVNGLNGEVCGGKTGPTKISGAGDENFEQEIKETIREILNIEKQLSLLYDKVFYTKGHVSLNTGTDGVFKMS